MDHHEGFAEFFHARGRALSRTAYLLTGDHQLAEDLLQSALAKAATRWPRLRAGNPEAYVRRVLYTEHVTGWRRRRLREFLSSRPPEPVREHSGDPAEAVVARIAVESALARLSPRQRAVLVLRFFEDLTEAQTAQALGVRVGTVKSQARDALARLRTVAPGLAELVGAGDDAGPAFVVGEAKEVRL